MSNAPNGRIPELDGIRGIAIAMVVAHHYFFIPPVGMLWSGVDLFFVLSGFLIGGILIDARRSPNYFRAFYTRRFFRIVPAYALIVASVFVLSLAGESGRAGRLDFLNAGRLPWTPYLLFLQNCWMAKHNTLGIFGLGVTWSLAVEEQFYLTLPLLVRFLDRRRLVPILISGICLAPILRICSYVFWPEQQLSWYVLMQCRADALLLGVLGAIVIRDSALSLRLASNPRILRTALAVLGVGYLLYWKFSPGYQSFPMLAFGFTWIAIFYVCILLHALTCRGWTSAFFRLRWLGWLGTIAYGTYLTHEFVRGAFFGLVWLRLPLPSGMSLPEFGLSILALGVTLTVCRFSWVYLESPLIQLGRSLTVQGASPVASSPLRSVESTRAASR